MIEFKVGNYARVSKAARELSNGERYRGYFKAVMTAALQDLAAYVSSITHKETGTLASGIIWTYDTYSKKGRVFIAPWAIKVAGNKLQWANVYGLYEHRRGGSHAFFARGMAERAPSTFARELDAHIRMFDA